MIRALTILVAVVALAVSVAPLASAGHSKKPPPCGTAGCTLIGEVSFPKARGAGVISSLGVKYTAWARKPPGSATRSVGEVVSADAYANALPSRSVKDGTSNTLLLGEGLVEQVERGRGGRVSPPKSSALHESEGIDGGFKAKPPHKRRLVSHLGDIKY
jgi:hypothetical protein